MRITVWYIPTDGPMRTDEFRSLRGIIRATSTRISKQTRTPYDMFHLARGKVIVADQKGVSYEEVASTISYATMIWKDEYRATHPDRHTYLVDGVIERAIKIPAEPNIILAHDAVEKAIRNSAENVGVSSSLKLQPNTDYPAGERPLIRLWFSRHKGDEVINSFQYKATVHAVEEKYDVQVNNDIEQDRKSVV